MGSGNGWERSSKNMYKGHMDKAKGGEDRGWAVAMGGEGISSGEDGDNCT